MANYVFPIVRERLNELAAEYMSGLMAGDPTFEIMPTRDVNAGMLEWTEKGNDSGLQHLRGLDGAPFHVQRTGKTSYLVRPGVFGEFKTLGENELTNRAGSVTGDVPVDIGDLVAEAQEDLIQREVNRVRQIVWSLLVTGTFSVSSNTGAGVTMTDTYTLQTHSGSDWSTASTATPIIDFRAVTEKGSNRGVDFVAGTAYMNLVTFNRMLGNLNANDLRGSTVNVIGVVGPQAMDQIMMAAGLPKIRIFDRGYFADAADATSKTLTKLIPDDKVVVVGVRDDTIGEYRLTRNLNNPAQAPGSYSYVKDMTGNAPDGQRHTPPRVEIHRGHNGGPVLYRPGAICVMSV
jgi:hypothetical protein